MEKTCGQCSAQFEITDEDRVFFKKMAAVFGGVRYSIPEPTLCPDCRRQRRLAWRNEWNLYHRTCDLTGKKIISIYSPESPFKVYGIDAWYSDDWDPLESGQDYDFNRPFFEQFREVQLKTPRTALSVFDNENSPYLNQCWHMKNSYLCFDAGYCEDAYYCYSLYHSKNVMDVIRGEKLELCYSCVDCSNCYNSVFLQDCYNCSDSYFSFDCKGCKNVLLCNNLRNKEYYIANQEVTPDEFKAIIEKLKLGSYPDFQNAVKKFNSLRDKAIHKENRNINCQDCLGDYLSNCNNCDHCFESHDAQDCKYMTKADHKARDIMDIDHLSELELAYNAISASGYHVIVGNLIIRGDDVFYCDFVENCKNCFGCCGIRKKEYCILNKQYSREEYEELVPRIIEQMKDPSMNSGCSAWGEFFPPSFSPFGYNETIANEHFPLTKEKALESGFNWCDFVTPPPVAEKTIQADMLPDDIKDIPDDILNWAIVCEESGKPFKIIDQELAFYRNFNLPIPHRHPDVRYRDREGLRNPRKMYTKPCIKCGSDMQTTYAPEREEKVYCEKCYLDEVY